MANRSTEKYVFVCCLCLTGFPLFDSPQTFGIMTAFGSYCPRGDPVVVNSLVISLANSCFSFISGFAVFAALGHLSFLSGIPVMDLPFAGFSLVFGTWPGKRAFF